jgi:hypothetical protein
MHHGLAVVIYCRCEKVLGSLIKRMKSLSYAMSFWFVVFFFYSQACVIFIFMLSIIQDGGDRFWN